MQSWVIIVPWNSKLPLPPTYAYQRSKSLILQFILFEFFKVCEEIRNISAVLVKEQQNLPELAKGLELTFIELSGPTNDFRRLFDWGFEEGRLLKLKHFCGLLLHDEIAMDFLAHELHLRADQLNQSAMNTLDAIRIYLYQQNISPLHFIESLKKMLNQMLPISTILEKIIFKEGRDENMLFFLLEHASEVKHVFGEHYFSTLFQQLHPNSEQGIFRFLITRYTKRGFSHLIPRIQQLLTDVRT